MMYKSSSCWPEIDNFNAMAIEIFKLVITGAAYNSDLRQSYT